MDQLVVRLEEMVALAVVGEWIEAAVQIELGSGHRQVGEMRLFGAAEEVELDGMVARAAARRQHIRPQLGVRALAVPVGLDS